MNSEKFFCNKDCKFFPCHKTEDEENFNCLYCFCPLYALGDKCGGNFTYTKSGVKNCDSCSLPHTPEGTEHINKMISEIIKIAKK